MFIFYYLSFCVLGDMGNIRFPDMPLHVNIHIPISDMLTHRFSLVGFYIAIESCWLFACVVLTPPLWNRVLFENGNYSVDFASMFDYASIKPGKSNCNWQIHQVRILSTIKKRMGFEREWNFESRRMESRNYSIRCQWFLNYFGMTRARILTDVIWEWMNSQFCGFFHINKCDSQLYFFFGISESASRAFLILY